MPYRYETERPNLFTDEGQRRFLEIRDRADRLLRVAGAATLGKLLGGATGDSFALIACVDRLVELGELRRVDSRDVASQHHVYVGTGKLGAPL